MSSAMETVLARIAFGQFAFRHQNDTEGKSILLYDVEPPYGAAHPFHLVLYSPQSSPMTTVMMTNLQDGWNSLGRLLAEHHRAIQVQLTSTTAAAKYAKNRFEVWANGSSRRSVMVLNDGGKWRFSSNGAPLPFEDLRLYKNRRIADRFPRAVLLQYAREMGWDVSSVGLWRPVSPVVHIEEDVTIRGAGATRH